MRFALALSMAVTLSTLDTQSAAQSFEAPQLTIGTSFEIHGFGKRFDKSGDLTRDREWELSYEYEGISDDGYYKFGKWEFDPESFGVRRKGKSISSSSKARIRLRFPFSFGDTWSYSFESSSSVDRCVSFKTEMTAKVADQMDSIEVDGQDVEVVWITHEGEWESLGDCGTGKREFAYAYAPSRNFWVKFEGKMYHPDGEVYRHDYLEMIDYKRGD